MVFAGEFGKQPRGDQTWWNQNGGDPKNDVFKVTALHDYAQPSAPFTGLRVQALGISEDFQDPALKRVVLDGRGYGGKIQATFLSDGEQTGSAATGKAANRTGVFDLEVVAFGGSNDDTIKTGVGNALLDGGGGNDALTTSEVAGRTLRIAGGQGSDGITVGNADGFLNGDGALPVASFAAARTVTTTRGTASLAGLLNWSTVAAPTSSATGGDDRITVGLGRNDIDAGPGNDSVGVAADDPRALLTPLPAGLLTSKGDRVVLGTGNDVFKGGTGPDTVWTGPVTTATRGLLTGSGGVDTAGAAEAAGTRNVVDTGSGGDTVFGSTADDLVTGGSLATQADHLRGGGGQDVLLGGLGPDELFGGPDSDWVVAEPAAVGEVTGTDVYGVLRSYVKTPLSIDPRSSKLLVGGDGTDRVVGGNGDSRLFGDRYETAPCGSPVQSPLSTQPVEPGGGGDGRDLILGGSGIDKVKAGGQADRVLAYAGDDLVCGQGGDDEVFGATGADTVWAGSGDDVVQGDDGADRLFGNAGSDRIFGAAGADVIEGNNGADDLFGGPDDDIVVGGTRATGVADTGRDHLYGDLGDDVLVGDNSLADGSYPVDLSGVPANAGAADEISGGPGRDKAYGGLGNDLVLGEGDRDDLEGNNGSDTIRGGEGDDQIVGGSSQARSAGTGWPDAGDMLYGDGGLDVLAGDNALLQRAGAQPTAVLVGRGLPGQQVTLLDLGTAPTAGTSGNDTVFGGGGSDAAFGQAGADALNGGDDGDLLEGGPGIDTVHGDDGQDDVVGGSSTLGPAGATQPDEADVLFGDADSDVVTGDNAALVLTGPGGGTIELQGRGFAAGRQVTLLDLGHSPAAGRSGADRIDGGEQGDALFGQGGDDQVLGQGGPDLAEGGPGRDTVVGGDGEDDIVGGSSVLAPGSGEAGPQPDTGDVLDSGDSGDVVLGDNGSLRRVGTPHPLVVNRSATARAIVVYDLGDTPDSRNSGDDDIVTGNATDVVLAQGGDDHADGGSESDYLEGGPGNDLLQGQAGDDDLVGGSYTPLVSSTDPVNPGATAAGQPDGADVLRGGADDDVLAGDNAYLLRQGTISRVFARLGSAGPLTGRHLVLLDRENATRLTPPVATRFGGDRLAGGAGVDLAYGQDGDDVVSGGGGPDYLQGNGGNDLLRGDSSPEAVRAGITPPPFTVGAWPRPPAAYDDGPTTADGQDDLIGGSDVRGFRDGNDTVEGNGDDDAVLADNGSLVRTLVGGAERLYSLRSRPTVERIAEPGLLTAGESTRFCGVSSGRCEVTGAFGADTVYGDAGDDGLWAQDGDDTVYGGAGDDDVFGELGDDTLFGDGGQDVLLGDRGGVQDRLASGSSVSVSLNSPPKEDYTAVRDGLYDRRVDLQNDTNGQTWVGTGTQKTMPLGGIVAGGNDRIRGGTGDDQIHGGFGDDLANGDTGGDELFGDDGADVLWGGQGCGIGDVETPCSGSDLAQRGSNDRFVDHLMGGYGGDAGNPVLGADILDWKPRGSFASCVEQQWPVEAGKDGANDPCAWFRMTETVDADPANDQHHGGTDWMYGGFDRDVMQGNLAANGPNPGDRMIDWNGTFNLWSHCNAAYGGFNDVRQHSPAMQDFLQTLAFGMGAGQQQAQSAQGGSSAFRELALVYPGDKGNAGKPYPSSPGHFDDPTAC